MITELFRNLVRLFTWVFTVAPWEQAVRVRLGSRVHVLGPGVYLRIPFVDRLYKQSIRRRIISIRPQTLTTKDGKVITVGSAVGFEVSDLLKLYNTVDGPNDTISLAVEGLVAQYVAEHELVNLSGPEIERFVLCRLDLASHGLSGKQFFLTSLAHAKAFRMITGEVASWGRDAQMTMAEHGRDGLGPPA